MAGRGRRAHRPGRGAARSRACRSRSRTCSAPRACSPPPARTSSATSCRPTKSTVTANLWRAGAVMLGKINMDEFAMGSSNKTSAFGPVVATRGRRAGDNARSCPAARSGGSAAAVAARLCLGATGTDTGGSIRQPAAFCRHVGIKPTYGRCSRWGIVAFASLARPGRPDRAHGRGRAPSCSRPWPATTRRTAPAPTAGPGLRRPLAASVKGLRIGMPKEYRVDGMPPEIERAVASRASTG